MLVAAAVILIPEMLSGPRRSEAPAPPEEQTPLKTFTIDFDRASNAPAAAPIAERVDERAPPQEIELPPADTPQSSNAAPASESSPAGASAAQGNADSTPRAAAAPKPTPAPTTPAASSGSAKRTERQASASAPAPSAAKETPSVSQVPTQSGWAVQAGSFSSRASAERVARELSAAGHDVFVMPVKAQGRTLYRVRIGPFADRGTANETLKRVKQRVANAAVVAHP